MKNLLNKILDYFLGEACPECGSRHLDHGQWIRGYNELCRQAAGAPGKRCYDCGHIIWDDTYEEYISYQPDWIRTYPDRPKKNNRPL